MMKKVFTIFIWMMIGTGISAAQQVSSFSFQGKLNDGGTAANGNYDMAFRLFDNVNAGTQVGTTITLPNVSVANGIFSVELDFGQAAFVTDLQRYLEIGIRSAGSSDPPTLLSPRQKIASSPFATKSYYSTLSFEAASLNCSNCVQDSAIASVSGNKVTGVVNEAATVSVGAGEYIINVRNWSGATANSFLVNTDYVFAGQQTSVTVTSSNSANQVTGSATAVFGTMGGTSEIKIHLCHKPASGGTITPFLGFPLEATVTENKSTFSVSATAILPVGTNLVGFCVQNFGPVFLNNNGRVHGWVIAPK